MHPGFSLTHSKPLCTFQEWIKIGALGVYLSLLSLSLSLYSSLCLSLFLSISQIKILKKKSLRTGVVAQWVNASPTNPPSLLGTSSSPTAEFRIHFPANGLGTAVEYRWSVWALFTLVKDTHKWSSCFLVSTWISPDHYGHRGCVPMEGWSYSLCLSPFLIPLIVNIYKWTKYK